MAVVCLITVGGVIHTQLASSYLRQLLRLREESSPPERELKRARYVHTVRASESIYILEVW